MSSEPVISLRHLSKKYPIYDRSGDKFLELLTLRRRQFHREFWALQDVDLEVHAGTTLGIMGQNGSGKSTMLQVVAGIMRQTRGDVQVRGTVAALLELGSGFNPEFTGIENVYMNGAIMGFTKSQMTRPDGSDPRFRGYRRLRSSTGQNILQRDVHAVGVCRGHPHRSRHPAGGRGAGGRGHCLSAPVHQPDQPTEGSRERRSCS